MYSGWASVLSCNAVAICMCKVHEVLEMKMGLYVILASIDSVLVTTKNVTKIAFVGSKIMFIELGCQTVVCT